MRYKILIICLAISCTPILAGTIASTISASFEAGIAHVSEVVRQKTGKRLQEVPMTCIEEHYPDDGKLMFLCEICYNLPKGAVCK